MDDLLHELNDGTRGLKWGQRRTAAIMFVDDLQIMAGSIEEIGELLDLIIEYSIDNNCVVRLTKSSIISDSNHYTGE